MIHRFLVTLATGIGLAATTGLAGGWAVTTIRDVPDYARVGTPIRLELAVRQHGVHLGAMPGVRVEAGHGKQTLNFRVTPAAKAGYFVADGTFPSAGLWTLTTSTGLFGKARVDLQVVTADAPKPVISAANRGRALFSAKGCVTCHRHDAVVGAETIEVAPDLSDRRYPDEVLKARLWKPSPCVSGRPCMPNLDLSSEEIGALVAFVNSGTTGATETQVRRVQ